MGQQLHDLSDSEEQVLNKQSLKMEQIEEAEEELAMMEAPQKKTRGLGGLFSFGAKKEAAQPKAKAKAPVSKFAGKQSDEMSTALYQMSN